MTFSSQKYPFKTYSRKTQRFSTAGTILHSVLKRHGLEHKVAEYQFVQRWSEIVGDEGAKRSFPEYIRGKTLVVRVTSPMWAQEFAFEKQMILERLEAVVGKSLGLTDIQFHVGQVRSRG